MCQRASSQTAPGKLQVGSQVIVCIYNVLVSQFVLLNDLPNRGGVTLLFGTKVAALPYLGRVVWSVQQAIAQ